MLNRFRFTLLVTTAVIAAGLSTGCGSGSGGTDNGTDAADTTPDDVKTTDSVGDSTVDAALDEGPGDTTEDTITPIRKCIESIAGDAVFRLLSSEYAYQIHPSAAFDGEALWLAWSNLDEPSGLFTIRAARMACDGTILVEPFTVDPENAGNSFEAEIAVAGDNLMIVWHQDYQGYYTDKKAHPALTPLPPVTTDIIASQDTTVADAGGPGTDTTVPDAADTGVADVAINDINVTDSTPADVAVTDIVYPPNDNMRVYYRTYKIDGTPVMSAPVRFMPEYDGEPALVNNWIPKVAAMPDGRFVIASTWAWPAGNMFQAVYQRVNVDGTLSGGLIHPFKTTTETQGYPDVSVSQDGTLHVVWSSSVIDGETENATVNSMTIPPDSDEPIEAVPTYFNPPGDLPSIKTGPDGTVFTAFFTMASKPDIVVVAENADRSKSTSLTMEETGRDFSPELAVGQNGPAVAWYRVRGDSSYNCDVVVKKLAGNADGITSFGDPITLNPPDDESEHNALSVYEPVITAIGEGYYFVAWSERQFETVGTDQESRFMVYGRFVKL